MRDSAMVALGCLHMGLHDEAGRILDRILDALVLDDGRTQIHSMFVDRADQQFDQAGELLFTLSQYVRWTGDRALLSDHAVRIRGGG